MPSSICSGGSLRHSATGGFCRRAAPPWWAPAGAVAAVLGGYALSYPAAKVRTLIFFGFIFLADLPALLVLGIWFILETVQGLGMLQGIFNAPVAFWAHVGGFVAGLILMPIMAIGTAPPGDDWRSEVDELFKF